MNVLTVELGVAVPPTYGHGAAETYARICDLMEPGLHRKPYLHFQTRKRAESFDLGPKLPLKVIGLWPFTRTLGQH